LGAGVPHREGLPSYLGLELCVAIRRGLIWILTLSLLLCYPESGSEARLSSPANLAASVLDAIAGRYTAIDKEHEKNSGALITRSPFIERGLFQAFQSFQPFNRYATFTTGGGPFEIAKDVPEVIVLSEL
jgi:hypothetical protein